MSLVRVDECRLWNVGGCCNLHRKNEMTFCKLEILIDLNAEWIFFFFVGREKYFFRKNEKSTF